MELNPVSSLLELWLWVKLFDSSVSQLISQNTFDWMVCKKKKTEFVAFSFGG